MQLLEWEASNGQDGPVQQLALEAWPTVLEHLRSVQMLIGELTRAAPQGLATAQAIDGSARH